jgi:hypothetical protein
MNSFAQLKQEKQSGTVVNSQVRAGGLSNTEPRQLSSGTSLQAEVSRRPQVRTVAQWQKMFDESPRVYSLLQRMEHPTGSNSQEALKGHPQVESQGPMQRSVNQSARVVAHAKLTQMLAARNIPLQLAPAVQRPEAIDAEHLTSVQPQSPSVQRLVMAREPAAPPANVASVQKKENRTGLPDQLKAGIETLSGLPMDDVRVERDSPEPAVVNALATTQGKQIKLGPGQEQHLAHEAWHVVQQAQGRVQPTTQAKGVAINDESSLEHEADVMGAKAAQMPVATQLKTDGGEPSWLGVASASAAPGSFKEPGYLTNSHQKSAPAIQRSQVIQRQDPWDPAAHASEVAEANAQNARLAGPPHPISIGPLQIPGPPPTTTGTQKHFDADMLREVRAVLDYLPPEHIVGNPALTRVVMEHATAANPGVSYFGNGELHVVVPFDAGSWVYLSMSKWPVGDLASTLMTNVGYAQNPNNPNLSTKWWETLNRDVVGTGAITNKLSMLGENFVNWLLKHETGHSVDHAIGFSANRYYRDPALGGWLIHDGMDTTPQVMRDGMLNALGLLGSLPALNAAFAANTGQTYSFLLDDAVLNHDPNAFNVPNKRAARNAFQAGGLAFPAVANGAWKAAHLEDVVLEGLHSPWQKGGKGGTPLANRTYQVEYQHTRWVSYDSAKYSLRNSNYQYSGPDEWFAESYAAYFTHSSLKFWQTAAQQWGNHLNDPAARAWFLANLDPINGPGALIVANALINIAAPVPGMAVQNPVVVPGILQRILEPIRDVIVTVAKLGVDGLFRVLANTFLWPAGLLKYLLWLPLNWLWRKILTFF